MQEDNIRSINVNQMIDLLSTAYISLIRNGTPLSAFPSDMLWGPPGVGKSQRVRQIAERMPRVRVIYLNTRIRMIFALNVDGKTVLRRRKIRLIFHKRALNTLIELSLSGRQRIQRVSEND